jgi:antitoxin PrlF
MEILIITNLMQAESTLTDRYQTTIPDSVRKALRLNKRDRIHYIIQPNGQVIMTKADQPEEDPVLGGFLSFLAQDIKDNPQHIQALGSDLVNRVQSLVAGVEFDLDAPLSDEDE